MRPRVRGHERQDAANLPRGRIAFSERRQHTRRAERRRQRRRSVWCRQARRQLLQTPELPQVARLAQRAIEGARGVPTHFPAVMIETEMWRPQQRDDGFAREGARYQLQDEVDGRGCRLGCERQPVRRLIGDSSRAERAAGEVEIRERPLEDDRRPVERREITGRPAIGLDLPCDSGELFTAVAVREPSLPLRGVRRRHEHGPNPRFRHAEVGRAEFFETGQPVVQTLVKTGAEHRLGRHDVEHLEPWNTREHVEIGDEQALRIGNPVGRRHNHVAHGIGGRFRDQPLAKRVLIAGLQLEDAPFVRVEGLGEEPRLLPHALGAAVRAGFAGERLCDELLEAIDRLRLAAQVVVEPKHFSYEPRPQLKRRRRTARRGLLCRGLGDGIALERVQPQGRIRKTLVQTVVEPPPCDDLGQHDDAASLQAVIFKRTPELPPSAACRHNDRARPNNVDVVVKSQGSNGMTEGVKIGDAHEPRSTRCDHESSGRRSNA